MALISAAALSISSITLKHSPPRLLVVPFLSKKPKMTIMTNDCVQGSLPEELMQLLVNLAQKWEDVDDPNNIQVKQMSGALTNEVFQIMWPSEKVDSHKKALLRIYGEGVDVFFNRDEEIRTFEYLSKHGQGPQLLGRFSDGRVEEFIHARTLTASDLRDPEISGRIAAKMHEFHSLDMPGPKEALLWSRMRNWLKKAKNLCSLEVEKEFGLSRMEDEIQMLKRDLPKDGLGIAFCHNDLQYGNIMMDEENGSITLIDYEYSSYNPVAYDLANHFCEMAADYHSETPHILNYEKYPDLEERRRFARAYLSSSGEEPSQYAVEELVESAEKYTLANHLFWGLWGLISAYVNKIEFDYKDYARQRFHQYWLKKPMVLGTDEAPLIINGENEC